MEIYVIVASQRIKLTVTNTMKLVQLIDQIFVECKRRGISNWPTCFQIVANNISKNLKQRQLSKTLSEIGITAGATIQSHDQHHEAHDNLSGEVMLGAAIQSQAYEEHNLSWEVLLHYVTHPKTADFDIAHRLLTKIGSGTDSCGNTPLHFLARAGWLTRQDIKDKKGKINNKNTHPMLIASQALGEEGYLNSPLSVAAFFGHEEVVTTLLDYKAKIESWNAQWYTPLHMAASEGHAEVVTKLLAAGAKVAARNIFNQTALHLAVSHPMPLRRLAVVRALLAAGTPVNAQDNSHITPLMQLSTVSSAIGLQWPVTATLYELISAGADLNNQDKLGRTALCHALDFLKTRDRLDPILDNPLNYVTTLVEAGASINKKDNKDLGLLYYSWNKALKIALYLAENGAAPYSRLEDHFQPISEDKKLLASAADKSYYQPIFQELCTVLFSYLDQSLMTTPIAVLNIINGYLLQGSQEEILTLARQHRELVFGALFRRVEEKPVFAPALPEIRSLYNTLIQSEILLSEKIKQFLVDRVTKYVSTIENPRRYQLLYIAIAEMVGAECLIAAIEKECVGTHLKNQHFVKELIELIKDRLCPPDQSMTAAKIIDDDFFSPDSKHHPQRLPDGWYDTFAPNIDENYLAYNKQVDTPSPALSDEKINHSKVTSPIEEPIPVTLEMVRDTVKDLISINQVQFNSCSPAQVKIDANAVKQLADLKNFADLRSWLNNYWSPERGELLNELLLLQMEDLSVKTIAKEVYDFLRQLSPVFESETPVVKNPQSAATAPLTKVGMYSKTGRSPPASTSAPMTAANTEMLLLDEMKTELQAVLKLLQKDVKTILSINRLKDIQEIQEFYDSEGLADELKAMRLQMNLIPESLRGPAFDGVIQGLQRGLDYVDKLRGLVEKLNDLEGKKIRGLQ